MNPYEVLGVSSSATEDEIKKAYRKLSKELHPDRAVGDEEAKQKYLKVQEAYEKLTKPEQAQRGQPSYDINDIFGDLFSSFQTQQTNRVQMVEIEISFMESLLGVKKEISFTSDIQCSDCSGQGNDPSCTPEHCNICGGLGRITSRQGNTVMSSTCGHCYGKGRTIAKVCGSCLGSGKVGKDYSIPVNIPAGIYRGMKIKLNDETVGVVNVGRCEYCNRRDYDLFIEGHISLSTALLGGEITVPSSSGSLTIKITKNSQTGTVLRIREKGFPHPERAGLKGDLYVKLNICIPEQENICDMEIIKKAEEESEMKNVKKFKEFFKSIT